MIFIISWSGQHENAKSIAKSILKFKKDVAIIYSDPDPNFTFDIACKLIKRPNNLFWGDKFKSCLDNSGNDGMLVIHADTTCEDWEFLVRRCYDVNLKFNDIGVWAPNIDGTYWDLRNTTIIRIDNSNFVLSAMIDAIVFYISAPIISRMKRACYDKNIYGWGIDGLFCATSYVSNKFVVTDTSVKIIHSTNKRGYDSKSANKQMHEFINQFSLRERLQYSLLINHVQFNHTKQIKND
jgi:hypothetical protein